MKTKFHVVAAFVAFVAFSGVAFAGEKSHTAAILGDENPIGVSTTGQNSIFANSDGGVTDNTQGTDGYHHGGGGGSGEKAFRIGADLDYNLFFQGAGSYFGLGINAEYATELFTYRFSFDYHFPHSTSLTTETTAYAISSFNPIPSVTVQETDKISISVMSFDFDAKKVFGDDKVNSGFYLFGGVGLVLASLKETVTYGSYDQTNYAIADQTPTVTASFSQLYINLGLGYGAHVGPGYLFGEMGLDLAANTANGMAIDVTIPSYLNIRAGYQISLGGK